MSPVEIRDFGHPEAVIEHPLGATYQVRLAGTIATRHVLQPGWSWELHVKPRADAESCEFFHRGVVLSGRFGVRMDDGETVVIEPNQVFDLPPGHRTWVEGDDEVVMVDWAGGAGFDVQPGKPSVVLATVLFTDIVGSTSMAERLGEAAWKRTMAMHEDVVRSVVPEFAGREVDTAGDSFLIVFQSAAAAIRCGFALVDALNAIGVPIRVGIHSGEVDMAGNAVRGTAINVAARILALAESREVLVSGTTQELAGHAGLGFESRGEHRLKGLSRPYELFVARPPA